MALICGFNQLTFQIVWRLMRFTDQSRRNFVDKEDPLQNKAVEKN